MRLNLSLFQKALVLITVPLVFQLIFVVILGSLRQQVEEEETRQVHARDIYRHVDELLKNVMQQSMLSITASLSRSIGYDDNKAGDKLRHLTMRIKEETADIRKFIAGHPTEESLFAECATLQDQVNESWGATKVNMDQGNKFGAMQSFKTTQKLATQMIAACDRLSEAEHAVESSEVSAQSEHRDQIEFLLRAAVVLNILLAIGLVFYFNKGTTKRLDALIDNTMRLAANMPLNPPLGGDDEIGRLDQTFSDMAEALAVAARQERAIVDKAMDVICSISVSGKFTRVSPAAKLVWGQKPDDLLGSNYLDLILPEDKDRVLIAMKEIKGGLRDEPIEAKVLRKDGATVDTLWSAKWSREDQTIFCVVHDITARKQSENLLKEAEARVRLIVESLPIGLLIIDGQGVIEFTNPCVKQLFGWSAPELSGRHIAKLFVPAQSVQPVSVFAQGGRAAAGTLAVAEDNPKHNEFKSELFERAKGSTWELDGIKYGGTVFPAEVGMTEFSASAGQRFLVVVVDATEKHAVERMRQEFIAMVSHDLRSPLTSVQTFLELLDSGICGDLNDKGKKKLNSANRSVERLIDLIRDLLDLERVKSGILIINTADISLSELVDRSVDGLRVQAEQLGIEIKSETPDVVFHADADRLVQAIVNLLSNSIKFSPQGSTITVSGRYDSEWIELRLTDQGRGIPPEDQARIFERFQQVSEGDYKRGTGLGLPICKAIVEQHGGTIGVDSEIGKGSTFWFRLPRRGAA